MSAACAHDRVDVVIGEARFSARFLDELAPATCRRFRALLPWSQPLIHARWSGEACWVPLGDFARGAAAESPTHRPRPGQLLFYSGARSESEVLLPYGATRFRCRDGALRGTPFLQIDTELDRLQSLGRDILWTGARTLRVG